MSSIRGAIALLFIGMSSSAFAQHGSRALVQRAPTAKAFKPFWNVAANRPPSQGLHGSLIRGATTGMANALTPSTLFKKSVDMKLLVLSADGTEPSFAAIKFFLDHIGIPYDAVVL